MGTVADSMSSVDADCQDCIDNLIAKSQIYIVQEGKSGVPKGPLPFGMQGPRLHLRENPGQLMDEPCNHVIEYLAVIRREFSLANAYADVAPLSLAVPDSTANEGAGSNKRKADTAENQSGSLPAKLAAFEATQRRRLSAKESEGPLD